MIIHKKDKIEILDFFYNMIHNLIIDYHLIYDDIDYEYVD